MLPTVIDMMGPFAMIGAGFMLGMVHALDADHVMAVSTLSNRQKAGVFPTLTYCFKWSMGHGGTLLIIGALFFALGIELPESVLNFAEASVGVLLMVIGGFCLLRIRKQKLQLRVHRHGDLTHAHWHEDTHHDSHTPTMVGMLHGLAGSAPALALVPVMVPLISQTSSTSVQLSLALAYLLVFSLGVLLAMALFGFGLGYVQQHLKSWSTRFFEWSQYCIAWTAIVFGGFWFSQAL